jgi:Methyltransferase domain
MISPSLVVSLTGTLKRLAWSSRLTRAVAVRAVDTAHLVKRRRGVRERTAGASAVPDEVPADLIPFHRYRGEFDWITGWFQEGAIATWDSLLAWQATLAISGNLFEIGVFKGKSAALMALRSCPQEICVFVDAILRREAIDVIETIRPANNVWWREMSQDIPSDGRLLPLAGTCRWIHIDGDHSSRGVLNDLEIATGLLSPEGVICLDDFMNPAYPQVTMATFRFLEGRPGELSLFLTGFNKGYLCRVAYAPTYLRFLKGRLLAELHRRELTDVTLWKTTDPEDMNCFGLTRKYLDHDYKGPDWAPHTIPI